MKFKEENMLKIIFYNNDKPILGYKCYHSVLENLNQSFLLKPELMEVTGLKSKTIKGFQDPKIEKAINRQKYFVELLNPIDDIASKSTTSIYQTEDETFISIHFFINSTFDLFNDIKQLYMDLIDLLAPNYGYCHFNKHQYIFSKTYSNKERTFHTDGLYWLNFFGGTELKRQGGDALLDNPHAETKKLPQGIFLQVCDDPFEAASPEGEQKLIKATEAMPPPVDIPY